MRRQLVPQTAKALGLAIGLRLPQPHHFTRQPFDLRLLLGHLAVEVVEQVVGPAGLGFQGIQPGLQGGAAARRLRKASGAPALIQPVAIVLLWLLLTRPRWMWESPAGKSSSLPRSASSWCCCQ